MKTRNGFKKLNIITIEYTDLTIFYSKISANKRYNKNSRIEIRKSTDHHVFIKKIHSNYGKSPEGRGVIEKPNYITNTLTRTLFSINLNFFVEFLELLEETLVMPLNTLLTSSYTYYF